MSDRDAHAIDRDRDTTLAERLVAKDGSAESREQAARELYERYRGDVHAIARDRLSPQLKKRFDPDDITQTVFRTFFRRANSYPDVSDEELRRILIRIAHRKACEKARWHTAQRRDARRESIADANDAINQSIQRASSGRSEADQIFIVENILASLPLSLRQVLELSLQGYNDSEIANAMGVVRRTVVRRKRLLKDIINRRNRLDDTPTG